MKSFKRIYRDVIYVSRITKTNNKSREILMGEIVNSCKFPDIKPSIRSYINKLNYNFLKRTMKLNTEFQRTNRATKLLYFFAILLLNGISWIVNLKPNSV